VTEKAHPARGAKRLEPKGKLVGAAVLKNGRRVKDASPTPNCPDTERSFPGEAPSDSTAKIKGRSRPDRWRASRHTAVHPLPGPTGQPPASIVRGTVSLTPVLSSRNGGRG
jgi:hypothetical protein